MQHHAHQFNEIRDIHVHPQLNDCAKDFALCEQIIAHPFQLLTETDEMDQLIEGSFYLPMVEVVRNHEVYVLIKKRGPNYSSH